MASVEKNLLTSSNEQAKLSLRNKLGASLAVAALLVFSACSSAPEGEPATTVEESPGVGNENVDPTAGGDQATNPDDPLETPQELTSEDVERLNKIKQQRMDSYIEFSKEAKTGDYPYVIDGQEYVGEFAARQSIELDASKYDTETDSGKETLVKDFMKVYQDTMLNGGLTEAEVERFGYGDPEDPTSLLMDNSPMDPTEGLEAAQIASYRALFTLGVGSEEISHAQSLDRLALEESSTPTVAYMNQRANKQLEVYKETGQLARLEVTSVHDMSNTPLIEEGQVGLLVEWSDNHKLAENDGQGIIAFKKRPNTSGGEAWVVTKFLAGDNIKISQPTQ